MSDKDSYSYRLTDSFFKLSPIELNEFHLFSKVIKSDKLDFFWKLSLNDANQVHQKLHLSILLSMYLIYRDTFNGNLLFTYISTENIPVMDKNRAEQQQNLNKLPPPFIAEINLEQKNKSDGRLIWDQPINVIKYVSPLVCNSERSITKVKIPAGECPLEIGKYDALRLAKTLAFNPNSNGIARFPYGHKRILLLVPNEFS